MNPSETQTTQTTDRSQNNSPAFEPAPQVTFTSASDNEFPVIPWVFPPRARVTGYDYVNIESPFDHRAFSHEGQTSPFIRDLFVTPIEIRGADDVTLRNVGDTPITIIGGPGGTAVTHTRAWDVIRTESYIDEHAVFEPNQTQRDGHIHIEPQVEKLFLVNTGTRASGAGNVTRTVVHVNHAIQNVTICPQPVRVEGANMAPIEFRFGDQAMFNITRLFPLTLPLPFDRRIVQECVSRSGIVQVVLPGQEEHNLWSMPFPGTVSTIVVEDLEAPSYDPDNQHRHVDRVRVALEQIFTVETLRDVDPSRTMISFTELGPDARTMHLLMSLGFLPFYDLTEPETEAQYAMHDYYVANNMPLT